MSLPGGSARLRGEPGLLTSDPASLAGPSLGNQGGRKKLSPVTHFIESEASLPQE